MLDGLVVGLGLQSYPLRYSTSIRLIHATILGNPGRFGEFQGDEVV